jgi:FtsH-binding integral membrane protein
MSDVYSFGGTTPAASDRTRTLFGQTMGFVALTAGLFALGAYLGRNISPGAGLLFFIVAFVCLIAMRFTSRSSPPLTVLLLVAFGLFMGLALAPTLVPTPARTRRRSGRRAVPPLCSSPVSARPAMPRGGTWR